MSTINVTSAPKTATFQMRINPEVKQRMEEIYARQGLSFTAVSYTHLTLPTKLEV